MPPPYYGYAMPGYMGHPPGAMGMPPYMYSAGSGMMPPGMPAGMPPPVLIPPVMPPLGSAMQVRVRG